VTGRRRRFSFGWEAAGGGDGRAAPVLNCDGLKICDMFCFVSIQPLSLLYSAFLIFGLLNNICIRNPSL
jgi:hypothetical protein